MVLVSVMKPAATLLADPGNKATHDQQNKQSNKPAATLLPDPGQGHASRTSTQTHGRECHVDHEAKTSLAAGPQNSLRADLATCGPSPHCSRSQTNAGCGPHVAAPPASPPCKAQGQGQLPGAEPGVPYGPCSLPITCPATPQSR